MIAPLPIRRMLRWLVAAITRLVYRVDHHGPALPNQGPALICPNHTAYVDPFVLVACGTYPLRFVYWSGLDRVPFVGRFCRFSGGIPIAGERQDPACYERAMEEIDTALAAGEVVVVFPEGQLTRDGDIGPFKRGIERIAAKRGTAVIPAAIDGLWGSVFSKGPRRRWRFRPRVRVEVGAPIAADAVNVEALRETVCSLAHRSDQRTTPRAPQMVTGW